MAWAALTAAALTAAGGCQRMGAAPAAATGGAAAAPAKVDGAPKEADLATVTLTPEAEARLAVALAPVERKSVPRTAMYAGEVTIPSGRLTAVTAPFVGTIQGPPGGGPLPEPGATVKKGQPVLVLQVILTPEARAQIAPQLADAEGQVKQSRDQLQIAKVNLDRAENLVRDRLGGSAALVDSKAQYELAQTNLRNAETRRDTLVKITGDINSGSMNQTITAPADGGLQNVHVQAGQVVAAGVALFEVAGLDPVWVKVPVYVGDFARLAKDRPAAVGGLVDVPGRTLRACRQARLRSAAGRPTRRDRLCLLRSRQQGRRAAPRRARRRDASPARRRFEPDRPPRLAPPRHPRRGLGL